MELLTHEGRTLAALVTIGPALVYVAVFGLVDLARWAWKRGRRA